MLDIESDGRQQVQPHGNSDGSRNDDEDGYPFMTTEGLLQQLFDKRNSSQRDDIKTEVHHLNQQEQQSNVAVVHGGKIIGRGKKCFSSSRVVQGTDWSRNWFGRIVRNGLAGRLLRLLHRNQKSIPAPGNGLNKTRIRGRIAKRLSKLVDDGVQTVIKIDEGVRGPELLPQIFPSYNFTGSLQQYQQNLKWLLLQMHAHAGLAQFTARGIGFENSEAINLSRWFNRHGRHDNRAMNIAKRCVSLVVFLLILSAYLPAENLQKQTTLAFEHYVELSEQRMREDDQSKPFLRIDGLLSKEKEAAYANLKDAGVFISRIETRENGRPIPVPGGMIHHWSGTTFIPGVTLAQTLAFLQDYDNHCRYYAPDVERSRIISRDGNHFDVYLRLRKKIALLDTEYDVTYKWLSKTEASAKSLSTQIREVQNAGQQNEYELPAGKDNGFMWRLNSYWRFAERDGGTYVQLEAVSLSRNIPVGLGWMIGPFVESIPKESLEFTLTRTRKELLDGSK
jgi:hypothetical protein